MSPARGTVALIVLVLITAACGGQPTTSGQPTEPISSAPTPSSLPSSIGEPTPSAPTTSPEPTSEPGPTFPPAESVPLPEPELTTVDEISQAMGTPGSGEQVAVSVLEMLQIGVYEEDGTVIRSGAETSDIDLYLFEPEVRGLAKLVEATFADDGWVAFRDFHAVLAEYGYSGSVDDLATEYMDLFAAEPDDPITQLVGYADPEALISKFAAWLLFVDGFVRHRDEAFGHSSLARTAGGVAQLGGPLIMDPNVIAHLILVGSTAQPTLTIDYAEVHEGHGVPGPPVQVKAHVRALGVAWVSPFTGQSLIPLRPFTTTGVRVEFDGTRVLTKHGDLSDAFAFTDGNGDATIGYTPRIEPAGGMGVEVSGLGVFTARVNIADVMTQLYGQPELAMLTPVTGITIGQLIVEWHDEPPMHIDFINTYNLQLNEVMGGSGETSGTDTISGDLIVDEDDPTRWEGTAISMAEGSFSGEFMGHACSTSWQAQQILEVTALEDLSGSGEMLFVFQPLTDPAGSMGSPTCNTSRLPSPSGIRWAPFNDLAVTEPSIGLRFNVAIPRPGFIESDYPVPLAGTGVTGNANWHVRIEFESGTP